MTRSIAVGVLAATIGSLVGRATTTATVGLLGEGAATWIVAGGGGGLLAAVVVLGGLWLADRGTLSGVGSQIERASRG